VVAARSQLVLALAGLCGCSVIDAAGGADPAPSADAALPCQLADDFEDGAMAAEWATWSEDDAEAREADGTVQVTFTSATGGWAGYELRQPIDLAAGEVRLEVAAVGGEFTLLEVDSDAMHLALYVEDGDTLTAEVAGTGADDDWVPVEYVPAMDVFWRIRGEGGLVHWESSQDGAGWESIHSQAAPFPLDEVQVSFGAGGVGGDPAAAFESFATRAAACAQ
jgi:hypothetical protein